MQGFHLDFTNIGGGRNKIATFSWGVYTIDSSSMLISVHVGATSDLLCVREEKTAFL